MASAQNLLMDSRLMHVRELRTEVDRLKADCARLRDENAMLSEHFDLALVAAQDLRDLPTGARQIVIDGWNLILGADREAGSSEQLLEQARAHLAAHPDDRVWIVFDGPRENVVNEARLRVSYTGGSGAHRADRFIYAYLRMARWLGLADRVEVKTHDRDFKRTVARLKG